MGDNTQKSIARTALTLVGYKVGGPIGGVVGGALGAWLFPYDMPQPDPLTAYNINTAQSGIPIPIVYGTVKVAGNYFWKGALTEDAVYADTGGKGMGGAGSKKQIVDYNYYMDGALGLCRGPYVAMTRMWTNNEFFYWEGGTSVTFYDGATDQIASTVMTDQTTSPVNYRTLAHLIFNDLPLGTGSASAPLVQAEAHRYPYNSDAGDSAHLFNYVAGVGNATTGAYGFSVKTSEGDVVMVGRDSLSSSSLKIYDRDMTTLKKQINLDALDLETSPYSQGIFDLDIIETGNKRTLYLLHYKNGSDLFVTEIQLNQNYKGDILALTYTDYNGNTRNTRGVTQTEIASSVSNLTRGSICHNSSYTYVLYSNYNTICKVLRFPWGATNETPTEFDISGTLTAGGGLTVTDDFAFVSEQIAQKLYSLNIDTFAEIEQLAFTTSVDARSVVALPGSDELVMIRSAGSGSFIRIYGYNKDHGHTLEFRRETDISTWWADDSYSGTLGEAKVKAGPDGTLVIGYERSNYHRAVQHVIMDAQPAQIIYDLCVNEIDQDSSELDLVGLQDLDDYCETNGLGLSFVINQKNEARDILNNMMIYLQAAIYTNNEGKVTFKPYRDTDTSQATITLADLEKPDGGRVDITMKDPRIIANRIQVDYIDRLANYKNPAVFSVDHFLAQEEQDEVVIQKVNMTWVTNPSLAGKLGWRLLKWAQYDTQIFEFDLTPEHLTLDPGDVITLNIPTMNLDSQKVRIMDIKDPTIGIGGSIGIVARLEESYLNTFTDYDVQRNEAITTATGLPEDVTPFVFEMPSLWTNDEYKAGIGFINHSDNVIGARIYIAENDLVYHDVGTVRRAAYGGDIEEALGEDDRRAKIDVGEYPDAFSSYTVEEQQNDASFSLIGGLQYNNAELANLEFVSFRATTTDGDIVTLKDVYRGLYQTTCKSHTTDEVLLQVGKHQFFTYKFKQPEVGKTIYIKMCAITRTKEQTLAEATAYEYTVLGETTKATHVGRLTLFENGEHRYGLKTYDGDTPEFRWQETYRAGGWGRVAWGYWPYNDFINGDITGYNILIYNDSGSRIATHVIGEVLTNYSYSKAQNEADFGVFTTSFFLGVQPVNPRGGVQDIVKIEVELI